jgi:hypothetical protein
MVQWYSPSLYHEKIYIKPPPGNIFLEIQKKNKKEELEEYLQQKYGD